MFFFFLRAPCSDTETDTDRLTHFLAWERVLGPRTLRWDDVAKRGLTLNRDEAARYLSNSPCKPPPDRQALYELLFDYHPELKLALESPPELAENSSGDGGADTQVFGGVDVGRDRFFLCELKLSPALGGPQLEFPPDALELEQAIAWLKQRRVAAVCIDGPPQPNTGALAARLPPTTDHNLARRVAEFQLGIGGCYGTPAVRPGPTANNAWMASSMDLYDYLARCMGYRIDLGDGDGQLFETHPTLAFKALLGCRVRTEQGLRKYRLDPLGTLRPKRTNAGRAQRISLLAQALNDLQVPVTDEVRARWRERVDWIDATICALIAAWRAQDGDQATPIGDPDEGSIYLHLPAQPMTVEPPPLAGADQPPVPVPIANQAQAVVPDGANAVILRLGQHGPGGMNQQDTVDIALLAADQDDLWIPVDSAAAFNLCQNLQAVGGHFYLAFGDQLVLYVLVDQCIHNRQERTPYPGPHNPWPVQQSYGWVRVAAQRQVDIGPAGFSVRHGDEWGTRFANRAALLWARVGGD